MDHLGPIQKTCAEAKYIFDNLPDNVVKIGLTIAKDVDEILADLDKCCPEVYHLSGDIGTFRRKRSSGFGTPIRD